MEYGAVVLAGSRNEGVLAQASPEPWEALIDLAGKPMVAYVLDALQDTRGIREAILVGPEDLASEAQRARARLVPSGRGLIENLARGVKAVGERKVLVITSDIPLIDGRMVGDFLERCSEKEGDFYYSVIPRPAIEARYPNARRTYVRLREGQVTGGNMMVLDARILEEFRSVAERLAANRKKPLALARLLGWRFVLRLLIGRLDIPSLEGRVSAIFGLRAHAIVCWDPEIGMDVDKPADLDLVRKALESK